MKIHPFAALKSFVRPAIASLQKERLGAMLDEDPALMERRTTIAKRLELYKSARDEIDSVAWK